MRRAALFLVGICLLPGVAHAELASDIIAPSRAGDWSHAGIPGGLPDAAWKQCGATLAAYDGTADKINAQIAKCGARQFVLLGAGTFHLSTAIDLGHKDELALRGSGAAATFLDFSGSNPGQGDCNLGNSTGIAVCSADKTDLWSNPPVFDWTGGLAQGSTELTLSDTTGIAPGSLLFLSQDDDGYSGYPASGSAIDNAGYFVCADQFETGPTTGCSYNGPDGSYPSPFTHRWQYEIAVAKSVSGKVVTLEAPVRHPNWRATQKPTAMLVQPLRSTGVEDLSIDLGSTQAIGYAVDIGYCDGCWISGVAVKNIYNWALGAQWSTHTQIQDSYVYNGAGPDPYGIRLSTTADGLVVNNIIHKMRAPLVFDEPDVGTVVAYNYTVNSFDGSDAMFPAFIPHSAGDDFQLYEGNIANAVQMDASHGTHLDETVFRNFLTGWESCANGNCGAETTKDWGVSPMLWPFSMRYGNAIGNVLGTPGFHAGYQTNDYSGCSGGKCDIFELGGGDGAATPPIPNDPLVATTMLRWANWDAVTDGVRFCGDASSTGFKTTCASKSEVPTSLPDYPNAVPKKGDTKAGQPPLPPSLYYADKPAWFGDVPFPPIGPDVSGGDVAQCAGTLNAPGGFAGLPATSASQCAGAKLQDAWAGHVNATPAMRCYLSLGGKLDGSGPALHFDAKRCYKSSSSSSSGSGGGSANGAGGGEGTGAGGGGGSSGGSSSGCGCRAAGDAPGGLGALIGLAFAVALRRSRRRVVPPRG